MTFMDLFKKKEAQPKAAESLDLPPPPVPESPIPSSDVRIVDEPAPMEEPMFQETISPVTATEMSPPMPEDHIESPRQAREQPLFVSVEDYQQVLGSISYIRNRLQDAEALVKKLNELKGSEEKEFDAWRSQLEDLQKKLAYVEDVIFAANEV